MLEWFSRALNTDAGQMARKLLVDLVQSTPEAKQELLSTISTEVSKALRDDVLPKLIEPMKAATDDAAFRRFIDAIVIPILVSMPEVIIPQLAHLDEPGMARRFREALSAVLLQPIGPFVIGTVDVLLEHALTEGENVIREVEHAIRDLGEQEPEFGVLAMVASGQFFRSQLHLRKPRMWWHSPATSFIYGTLASPVPRASVNM